MWTPCSSSLVRCRRLTAFEDKLFNVLTATASEADLVTMFAHVPGRKLLLAATSGHGFVTSEDEAVAMTRSGKKVMNVKPGIEAAVCRPC